MKFDGVPAIARNGPFIRNFLKMFGGSASARLLTILVAPIISRLFEPEMFGLATVFSALVFLLTTIATLRYDQAIIVGKDTEDAAALTRLTVLILVGFSVFFMFVAGALLLFHVPLGQYTALRYWLLLVPVGILIIGSSEILRGRIVRQKQFSQAAQGEVIFAACTAGSRIGGGVLFGASLSILIIGNLLGNLTQAGYLAFRLKTLDTKEAVTTADLKRVGRQYSQFPLYATPTAFLRTLSEHLPVLALGFIYAPAIAGYYAFASRLVGLPANLINRAIRQVYLQKAAEKHHLGQGTRGALLKTTLVLLLIGLLPTIGLMMFGETLFGLFLGERWATAGRYAEIISPALLFTVANAPASATFMVYGRQKRLLAIQASLTASRVLVLVAAFLGESDVERVLILLTLLAVSGQIWIILTASHITRSRPAWNDVP